MIAECGRWSCSLIATLGLLVPAFAPNVNSTIERRTLDSVLLLAGLDRAGLPMTLTSVVPEGASPGVEAWTTYGDNETGERIFVYTGSDMFRCASWPLSMHQCLIRLASVLVHEAWHFNYGRNEADAYEAQIAFLSRNRATADHIQAVRIAADRVVAAQRRAVEEARKRHGDAAATNRRGSTD